ALHSLGRLGEETGIHPGQRDLVPEAEREQEHQRVDDLVPYLGDLQDLENAIVQAVQPFVGAVSATWCAASSSTTVPPAASIFWRALCVNFWARTVNFLSSLPLPRIFRNGVCMRASPFSRIAPRSTVAPVSNDASLSTFTSVYSVRKRALVKP